MSHRNARLTVHGRRLLVHRVRELGMPVSALAVASYYADLLDGFVLDRVDAGDAPAIEALGMAVCITDTIMAGAPERARLAQEVLRFAATLNN